MPTSSDSHKDLRKPLRITSKNMTLKQSFLSDSSTLSLESLPEGIPLGQCRCSNKISSLYFATAMHVFAKRSAVIRSSRSRSGITRVKTKE
ncbi:MAG: hypothetical protein HZB59_05840 [Ignavibacteriales bacterium]|nr:hypothetical protein [Ignavibacteriales bacterium]